MVSAIMAGVRIEKPRVFQSTKDILMTLGILLLAMFLVVGFTGLCSVDPGRPEAKGPVQEVEAESILKMDAQALDFPIRYPEMPDGWVSNSQRRTEIGQDISVLTGWVIDGEMYISLTQTPAPLDQAKQPDEDYREQVREENIDGQKWIVMEGDDARPVWATDLGDVRLVLKAMATDELMRAAAKASQEAKPIERNTSAGATTNDPKAASSSQSVEPTEPAAG